VSLADRDGNHPRPQLVRHAYQLLDGACGFAFDDEDRGLAQHWELAGDDIFDRTIVLPFSPESPASGIGDTGFHRVVWYRIPLTAGHLAAAGLVVQGDRVLLHFGAVDRVADVWVDGTHVGRHEGGQTAFAFDVTHALADGDGHVVVVRAEDDPLDAVVPRGKQDWHEKPHAIWYQRITGIWRSVWLEAVPALHVADLVWTPDVVRGCVTAEIQLSARPRTAVTVSITAAHEGETLSRMTVDTTSDRICVTVPIAAMRNGQALDELLWHPDHPTLIDLTVGLDSGDTVESYVGLRSVSIAHSRVLLNDRPFPLRSVLQQGYWPQSHFTAPSVDAMRAEVELALALGFNSVRIHQKVEDARFLYWCDRLGLTVWAEAAAAYEFSGRAVELFAADWARIVRSQQSHPSVIVWVPFNESWGIQHVAHDPAQRAYSRSLTELTRALDPSRPVISNDGWEHTDSDIITIHDYESSGEVLSARYGEHLDEVLAGIGGPGRRVNLAAASDAPVMLTEFGGVRFGGEGWGYSSSDTVEGFRARVGEIFAAVHGSPGLSGFCYTQLTDTAQEVNGLCDENRVPKLPVEVIRAMVGGTGTVAV